MAQTATYTPHSPKRIEGDLCPQCRMPMGIIRIEREWMIDSAVSNTRPSIKVECARRGLKRPQNATRA